MSNSNITEPEPVRIEKDRKPMLIVGLSESYSFGAPLDGAAQWERFAPYLGNVPGQVEEVAYGVCFDWEDGNGVDYLCGVEVSGDEDLPNELAQRYIPGRHYAVFVHEGHVSTLRNTLDAIAKWLPQSDYE